MLNRCKFTWYGQEWTCRRSRSFEGNREFGGCMISDDKLIVVNKSFDIEKFLDYLHHELYEGACYLSGCCFGRGYPEEKDMYIMDHTQMDVISSEVRGAYEMIKKNMNIPKNGRY